VLLLADALLRLWNSALLYCTGIHILPAVC